MITSVPETCGNEIFVQKWVESKSDDWPNHGLVLQSAEAGNEKFLFTYMITGLL
jgi:hypothetical protein